MNSESISVVLTVENAQNWIAGDIESLIDCIADLTTRFEIIVVDNGSRDYTIEILEDLRCRYPQIVYRRMPQCESFDEALAYGLAMVSGDLVFTTAPNSRVEPEELRRLWNLRTDRRLLIARSKTTARRIDPGLISRLTGWAQRMTPSRESAQPETWSGMQMLRREAVDQLHPMLNSRMIDESGKPQIEISHISHQQLAGSKLAEAKRRSPASMPGI